ncbi:NACHT domain-containing protein [Burkholderia gladioli]|uniref:NACHT domain-containing protein n=1 Tax=Burkholderia gladioli TaxID=28095 RepID=UPI001641F679|nr:NACHT domain-containing protein [Burkholderia gladioli]
MTAFTPTSLVAAITQLFELNHYKVTGPVKVHGAEIDLVATPLGDPFGRMVYIEATVEYVDNDKYGKDVGKLAMIAALEPDAQKLIVSSSGFSLPVKERAEKTRISTLTYDELFQRFEKFEPYLAATTGSSEAADQLCSLVKVYEEPTFEDVMGNEQATSYLTEWKNRSDPENRWIVVTGEYGTGKTALTQVLLYRWLLEYRQNPRLPIPFRIELRSFVRQFDARGLLHHFLDSNGLSHIPIDFAERLVRSGRAVLILDGYDEMAQYFNSRERRQCLEALASLSAEGAKGIITSRPNYFTQSEELQVFEVLYASLKATHYLSASATSYLEHEAQVDRLLAQFIDQYERKLRDLSHEQTVALITRILGDDKKGLEIVLGVLARVFRHAAEGSRSLSGKPVIVSYLLEVVEQLKVSGYQESDQGTLTEWQIYRVIVDQLMLRDLQRSSEVPPDARRKFLQRLALYLSRREHEVINEDDFRDLVVSVFRREINRHSGEARSEAMSRYFSDLRSSATLTRTTTSSGEGWRFSHNSLREYLIAEHMSSTLEGGDITPEIVPISDAMRVFVSSMGKELREKLLRTLVSAWPTESVEGRAKGQLLELLWDGLVLLLDDGKTDISRAILERLGAEVTSFAGVSLSNLTLSSNARPSQLSAMSFQGVELSNIHLCCADLSAANFSNSTLDNIDFSDSLLRGANFSGATLFDVVLIGANIEGADFCYLSDESTCLIVDGETADSPLRVDGKYALGFLKAKGALTGDVPDYYVLWHHPRFSIVYKVIENLTKQSLRQRRGLEQRGAAHADVPFARSFIDFLLNKKLLEVPKARKDLVEPTEAGRDVFQKFIISQEVDPLLLSFFE